MCTVEVCTAGGSRGALWRYVQWRCVLQGGSEGSSVEVCTVEVCAVEVCTVEVCAVEVCTV